MRLSILKNSLQAILPIKEAAEKSSNASLNNIGTQLHATKELREKIEATLFEDAPVNINKGNSIATGVSQELDDLRAISTSGKTFLDNMLQREIERTGIYFFENRF